MLELKGQWYATSISVGENAIPAPLRDPGAVGHARHPALRARGHPRDGGGAARSPASTASYFEVFSLDELGRTLRILALALAGGRLGDHRRRRRHRPLGERPRPASAGAGVAGRAETVAGGSLDTRLLAEGDPELSALASSFNRMADALQERIDHEVRFTSDVSHELRSPLTTLATSLGVLESHRRRAAAAQPPRPRPAQRRAAPVPAHGRRPPRDQPGRHRLGRALARRGRGGRAGPPGRRRRGRRPMSRSRSTRRCRGCGSGSTSGGSSGSWPTSWPTPTSMPGVSPGWRSSPVPARGAPGGGRPRPGRRPGRARADLRALLPRPGRRPAGRRPSGTGLGLSLVAEHVRLHGGRVWVETGADGENRFVVELPDRRPRQDAAAVGVWRAARCEGDPDRRRDPVDGPAHRCRCADGAVAAGARRRSPWPGVRRARRPPTCGTVAPRRPLRPPRPPRQSTTTATTTPSRSRCPVQIFLIGPDGHVVGRGPRRAGLRHPTWRRCSRALVAGPTDAEATAGLQSAAARPRPRSSAPTSRAASPR